MHSPDAVRPGLVLGICCLSLLVVGMDATVVNVAIPAIESGVGGSFQEVQWVIDGYTLTVACLLLVMGSVSDRFGQKRTFQVGLAVFTSASLLCSAAPDVHWLIGSRFLQGSGAAMLNPVALSIIVRTHPEPQARARAIGIWGATFGVALGLGPIAGAVLSEAFGWRAIFLINLPIGVAALVLTARCIPESTPSTARAFDPLGQGLLMVVLGSLTYGVIEGQRLGWGAPWILGALGLSAVCVALLIAWERRQDEPLLEMHLFANLPFSGAIGIALIMFAGFAALLFFNALYLQHQRGYSILQAALCSLPLAVMASLCGPWSGRLVGRYGPRPSLLMAGAALMISSALLAQIGAQTSLGLIGGAYGLFGAGMGLVNPAITTIAVSRLEPSRTGVTAAILSTSRQLGACWGVAGIGSVMHAGLRQGLGLAQASQPWWWGMSLLGLVIATLSGFSKSPRQQLLE
ncbi:MFS transporter [Pseudomonas sp. dw_358]|uniref:MFS transporter n=1 Tax=Pseudomonas sp. dw_358 TaxID=2720083 RepID=UPI001BD4B969|nr:MFS transporter [Pseudomonas sp. dw_358]